MVKQIIADAEKKFSTSLQYLQSELAVIRSSQASPALVEDIEVTAYDGKYTIKELAAISLPEPSTILIQVWDQTVIQNIENALLNSGLGAKPAVEGANIRLAIPPLSQDKRNELAKKVGEKIEEAKVAIRNIRQEKIKSLDNLCDDSLISEDEHEQARKEIQKSVDNYNVKIEEAKKTKVDALNTI